MWWQIIKDDDSPYRDIPKNLASITPSGTANIRTWVNLFKSTEGRIILREIFDYEYSRKNYFESILDVMHDFSQQCENNIQGFPSADSILRPNPEEHYPFLSIFEEFFMNTGGGWSLSTHSIQAVINGLFRFTDRLSKMFSLFKAGNIKMKIDNDDDEDGIIRVKCFIDEEYYISEALRKLCMRYKGSSCNSITSATTNGQLCLQMERDIKEVPVFDKVFTILMYFQNADNLDDGLAKVASYWKYLNERGIQVDAAEAGTTQFSLLFPGNTVRNQFNDWKKNDETYISDASQDRILIIHKFGLTLSEHINKFGVM
tara:strand:- start:807 stop:1751 length:945 start_codon:yes stop_codon:yes gene_type:complete